MGPFQIEVEGMKELLATFKTIEEGMLDFRQLGTWKAVAHEFRKIEKEQFSSEGSAGRSGKWKPLTAKYAERKQKKYGSMPILQATGKGYRSLTVEGAEGAVYNESAQELVIGSSIPYMAYHQRGSNRLPKREPVSFTEAQEQQLVKPVQDKLRQLIANAKLRQIRGF